VIRRYSLALVALLPFAGHAADPPGSECAIRGHYAEQMLFSAVTKDGVKGIERGKTAVEVLSITPVSEVYAHELAEADAKAGNGLSVKDYYGIYHDNGALNLTVKYTYTSAKGQHNVYIVSSLLNNDECSLRFNGYLTLSREF
jgi:hypothetical protein